MKALTYWEKLSDEERPIILYGTGNGADKIIDACREYGIRIDGVFASSGFVRDRTFRDMPVLSYDRVIETFGEDVVILPAFGTTLPDVMDFFALLDSRHEVIIPEVPLYGGGIFDSRYLDEHIRELDEVYGMLSDDTSRELLRDAVLFRITGKLKYLGRCESMRDTMRHIPGMENVKVALDGGAFRGDSASDMLSAVPDIERIIACEPDPSTFKKLSAFAESEASRGVVIPYEAALSDHVGVSEAVASGSRGSGIAGRNRRAKVKEISLATVDSIIGEGRVDYIKLDVEGNEADAIRGAVETLRRERPIVSVSLYHRTGDVYELPLLLKEILGECRVYLRRPRCIPMWDLNAYAVPVSRVTAG